MRSVGIQRILRKIMICENSQEMLVKFHEIIGWQAIERFNRIPSRDSLREALAERVAIEWRCRLSFS